MRGVNLRSTNGDKVQAWFNVVVKVGRDTRRLEIITHIDCWSKLERKTRAKGGALGFPNCYNVVWMRMPCEGRGWKKGTSFGRVFRINSFGVCFSLRHIYTDTVVVDFLVVTMRSKESSKAMLEKGRSGKGGLGVIESVEVGPLGRRGAKGVEGLVRTGRRRGRSEAVEAVAKVARGRQLVAGRWTHIARSAKGTEATAHAVAHTGVEVTAATAGIVTTIDLSGNLLADTFAVRGL